MSLIPDWQNNGEGMSSLKYSIGIDENFGFRKVVPTPPEDIIARYYLEEFYSSQYGGLNDSSASVQIKDKEYYDARWQDILDSISEKMGDLRGKSVLDIGCGWGQALLYFKEKGLECYGFDPAQSAIDFAKAQGLNVKCSGLQDADVFGKRFDIVVLVNVLEHLPDPEKILKEIREKIISPDGILVIDVPNEYNTFQTIANSEYNLQEWWLVPPAHLNYFNAESLRCLLDGCGFNVNYTEASFPLEIFMLFGDIYVGNPALGRECHKKRMLFEKLMRKHGETKKLRMFYESLASLGLGRQIVTYASPK